MRARSPAGDRRSIAISDIYHIFVSLPQYHMPRNYENLRKEEHNRKTRTTLLLIHPSGDKQHKKLRRTQRANPTKTTRVLPWVPGRDT